MASEESVSTEDRDWMDALFVREFGRAHVPPSEEARARVLHEHGERLWSLATIDLWNAAYRMALDVGRLFVQQATPALLAYYIGISDEDALSRDGYPEVRMWYRLKNTAEDDNIVPPMEHGRRIRATSRRSAPRLHPSDPDAYYRLVRWYVEYTTKVLLLPYCGTQNVPARLDPSLPLIDDLANLDQDKVSILGRIEDARENAGIDTLRSLPVVGPRQHATNTKEILRRAIAHMDGSLKEDAKFIAGWYRYVFTVDELNSALYKYTKEVLEMLTLPDAVDEFIHLTAQRFVHTAMEGSTSKAADYMGLTFFCAVLEFFGVHDPETLYPYGTTFESFYGTQGDDV